MRFDRRHEDGSDGSAVGRLERMPVIIAMHETFTQCADLLSYKYKRKKIGVVSWRALILLLPLLNYYKKN